MKVRNCRSWLRYASTAIITVATASAASAIVAPAVHHAASSIVDRSLDLLQGVYTVPGESGEFQVTDRQAQVQGALVAVTQAEAVGVQMNPAL
jgi:hypothetical protein